MVLMDYSELHLHDDPKLKASNDRFPSFVYAMPLAEDELFLEETILVSRPGGSSRDLQARLEKRIQALGINTIEVLEEERAAIPMGGMDPTVPQRVSIYMYLLKHTCRVVLGKSFLFHVVYFSNQQIAVLYPFHFLCRFCRRLALVQRPAWYIPHLAIWWRERWKWHREWPVLWLRNCWICDHK
jgi:hypothetical protein